jgi:hypothetical protein
MNPPDLQRQRQNIQSLAESSDGQVLKKFGSDGWRKIREFNGLTYYFG